MREGVLTRKKKIPDKFEHVKDDAKNCVFWVPWERGMTSFNSSKEIDALRPDNCDEFELVRSDAQNEFFRRSGVALRQKVVP